MQSTFMPTGLGYVFTLGDAYDPELLTIEVTNIRQRAGSIYALLTTSTTVAEARHIPGTQRVLNAEVWLLSDRSRMDYATALTRVIPAPAGAQQLDFSAVLQEIAALVIDAESTPARLVHLNGAQSQQPPLAYLLEGIIPVHKPTILYGAGGVGKSIFAAALAVAVQYGTKFLGRLTQQAEVLYLDWETDADDIGKRMHAAAAGLGVLEPTLRYIPLVQPLENGVGQLARIVTEEKIGLVIIDSAGMAMATSRDGSDASETAIRFFRSLRAFKAATLVIDHVSGDDMRKGRGSAKPYGSIYKWNSARNAFELRASRDPDLHGSHLLLKHRKTNVGPLLRDMPVNLIWDDARGVATFGLDTPPVATPQVPLPEQILDILAVGSASPQKIADLLSEDGLTYYEMDVRRTLKQLLMDGKVSAGPDGAIRVAQHGTNAVESPLLDT